MTVPTEIKTGVPESLPGREKYIPQNHRRILLIFPRYSKSFGTFHYSYKLTGGRVKAFMPPQGLLLVAAYLPKEWDIRLIDENAKPATEADYRWADAVITSGMHIQRPQINEINAIAHRHGKITVVGGPSVSGCPEYYPDFDILRVGELGDADEKLIEYLDNSIARPTEQLRFETLERLPLSEFPTPAYHHINLNQYLLGSVQFSSGCPFNCEFCDIPTLYGHNPRLKTPEQILKELDAMLESGNPGLVYFVDDNFIGNRRAVTEFLPKLIEWQKQRGYPLQFACEATLNIAQSPKLLELMREAYFTTVFCGIETPETEALHAISKDQNLSMPILDAVKQLNKYGMEVVSGIIIGFDTDTPETGDRILDFIRASNISVLTINLLYALPKTALWARLEKEGRLLLDEDPTRESNVKFLMPYDQVVEMWRRVITTAYSPEFLYERYQYQVNYTYANRIAAPNSPARVNWPNIKKALIMMGNILIRMGVFGSYRKTFWKLAGPALKAGKIEDVIGTGWASYHLIEFAKECATGQESASFYSQKVLEPERETVGV
ncbi:B12-binding domain-containing radical SAM protein [Altericista sp. CCNU0014]|uniref:B12-binding domain-containing radical SAM protein n=1 Tax=Altericista sp. CCNU0014 TaxID=3082949 RepID=UPI00384DEFA1